MSIFGLEEELDEDDNFAHLSLSGTIPRPNEDTADGDELLKFRQRARKKNKNFETAHQNFEHTLYG